MTNVMFVVDFNICGIGGAQKSTNILIDELCKHDFKISLVIYDKIDKTIIKDKRINTIILKNIKVRTIKLTEYKKLLKYMMSIKEVICSQTPDIIFAQSPLIALAIGFLKKYNFIPNRIKLVYISREMVDSYSYKLKKAFKFFVTKVFSYIVCTTHKNGELWNKLDEKTKIFLLPNAAGRLYEVYNDSCRKAIRGEYEINDKINVIGFCGRMASEKNWPMVYEICKEVLLKTDAHIAFAIGAENLEEERKAKNITKLLKRIDPKRVIFDMNLNQAQMSDFYYLIDIFVLCSHTEAFGRTAIEAMSRKCTIIGRNVGGLPEVIVKKSNIVDNNKEAFTRKINEYLCDSDKLYKEKIYYYNLFNNKYTISVHKNLLMKLIKELVKEDMHETELFQKSRGPSLKCMGKHM